MFGIGPGNGMLMPARRQRDGEIGILGRGTTGLVERER